MTKTFFIADPHFGHENACVLFKRPDGTPLRHFKSASDADEYMVSEWNKLVSDEDRVNLCGDVVINRKFLHTLGRLKGRIRLVMGNHDIFKNDEYQKYVTDLAAYVVKKGFVASHMPIHTDSIDRFSVNIHGHLHYNVINDPRYISVSVEQTQYIPLTLDQVMARVAMNQTKFEETQNVINFADLKE